MEQISRHLCPVECVDAGQTAWFLQIEAFLMYITLDKLLGPSVPQLLFHKMDMTIIAELILYGKFEA